MPRFRFAALGAVLALVALFSTASAGPIGWQYSGVVEATNGGPFVHFGTENKHGFDPATGHGRRHAATRSSAELTQLFPGRVPGMGRFTRPRTTPPASKPTPLMMHGA